MKVLFPTLFLATILSGCFSYRELPVEYDYSYSARFTKYKTFDMFEKASIDEDSALYRDVIEQTIISRMKILGYRQSEKKPNILISYRIFYDSLKFNGYNQPDIEDWVMRRTKEDEVYNEQDFSMKEGTLLIQFFDRKLQKSIWQGYATSEFGGIKFQEDRNLRNAVISILDKYRFLAEGFLENEIMIKTEQMNE
jgi:hypothetical protein